MHIRFALIIGAVAIASLSAQTSSQQSTQTPPQQAKSVTVTGCVAAGPNNTYTLTGPAPQNEPPLGTTATTPAGEKVAKTVTYTLSSAKPDELKSHVGHTVQVTGTESAPQATAQVTDRSTGTAAAGTTGSGTASGAAAPKVETTAQAQIVARQLTVSAVKMVSANCSLLK
jgi:hypothetical protein